MKPINEMKLQIESRSVNEAFARAAVAAFASQLDPNVEEISDIKTAVSEAVTNCIVHAYADKVGVIYIWAGIYENSVFKVKIKDKGCGISNVKQAMEPLFTSKPDLERSGMGFSFMEAFMDEVQVESLPKRKGTLVRMKKEIGKGRELWTTQSI